MLLALLCVLLLTLIMLADLKLCVMVVVCVLFTLVTLKLVIKCEENVSFGPSQVDVTGTAYFIGQTIDSVSCICMVLAIGFSVDYSVHIGTILIGRPKNFLNF